MTCVVADAASGQAISSLIEQVIKEEGQLDFFFANAGVTMLPQFRTGDMKTQLEGGARRMTEISSEEFAEVMRINALRSVTCHGIIEQLPQTDGLVYSWRSSSLRQLWPK